MNDEGSESDRVRNKTDESLRTERANISDLMAERSTGLEANAAVLVKRARKQADAVVDAARAKADSKLDTAEHGIQGRAAVARERALEDKLLQAERLAADETLGREREVLRTDWKNLIDLTAERRAVLEASADELVKRARQQADAVMGMARAKADSKLDTAEHGVQGRRERALEDEVIQDERAAADETLGREREVLRAERKNATDLMSERRAGIETNADDLVKHARQQADTVVDTARAKADSKLDTAQQSVQGRAAVARERAVEDEVLQDERAAADETLDREREEQARTLAALMPLEREKTDRYLLTERARSDDALAHRDNFMGMVSHDLRNLLSGIVMSATMLSAKASESDEGRRTVDEAKRIQKYVARMNRLIGDLIDVVGIDAGKLAVRPERCDAAALVTEAVDAFAPAASEKGISLEIETVERPLLADFDNERMLQVLANLITNALKFTARGGRIAVRAERAGDELRVCVSDTGTGIPNNMLEAVFERFWQVGENDRRGLGLGLYISKCIVDAHGGRIWVESTLGEGSAFHFTIPRAVPRTA